MNVFPTTRPTNAALALLTVLLPAAVMLLTAGCDSVLEEEPQDSLVSEQYFQNGEDAVSAVNAAYDAFSLEPYYAKQIVMMTELQAEYARGRGSYVPGGNYSFDVTNVQRIGSIWNVIYQGINSANLVIDNVPGIDDMDPALKERVMGEAHYIRAFHYYNLVRLWGPVPLRTTSTQDLNSLDAPRAPVDEVYSLIISDLQTAEENLAGERSNDIGRATEWAAKTALADVYLTRERFGEAAAKAREVIDSGAFSLVSVDAADDFDKMYGPDVSSYPEEIWSVKFGATPQEGTILPTYLADFNAGYGASGYRTILGVEGSFLSTWDQDDLRYPYNLYTGEEEQFLHEGEPFLFRKFRDPDASTLYGHSNDFPVWRLVDALLIYAEATALTDGPTDAAYDALNRVHRRAYGYAPNEDSPVDIEEDLGADAFRDAVLEERKREFMIESKRWFDLLRTGRALEVIRDAGFEITEQYLRWPIPQSEIDNNPALGPDDQNPGW